MTTGEAKTFSLTLSPQVMLAALLTVLPVIGGSAYYGITTYNRAMAAIEEVDGIGELKEQVLLLQKENNALKERLINAMDSAVRAQEKAADALALSRETKAGSDGTTREVRAELASIRIELKGIAENIRAEMNSLRRATMNPLSGN
jgi:hypothetical protein